MNEKVQQAIDLVVEFEGEDLDEFLLGVQSVFTRKREKRLADGPVKAAATTPDIVWEKLTSGLLENEDDKLYYHYRECLERGQILSDLDQIDFDLENIELDRDSSHSEIKKLIGPRMFGNVAGVGCEAGGDWEWPVFFIIYLGEDNVLHGYFPKDGNMYNHNNDSAFGNAEDGEDEKFLTDWLQKNRPDLEVDEVYPSEQHGDLMFNEEKILADITKNVLLAS